MSNLRELVVISGKGGTGKTSISASLAALAPNRVIADCDVDAADLHLLLAPRVRQKNEFRSGHCASIRSDACTGCGVCANLCRYDAIRPAESGKTYLVDPGSCEGCNVCVRFCKAQAIDFPERLCGDWMISDTRLGTLVHAQLHAGGENSGKLVTAVRTAARAEAEQSAAEWIITDGPPGIGCPVIATVTGASQVLVVTEPTVSGEHDLERVLRLARHFRIPAAVCVNKWDLNPEATERIEALARTLGAIVAGRVRYDRAVTAAQLDRQTAIERDTPSAADIRALWAVLNPPVPSAT